MTNAFCLLTLVITYKRVWCWYRHISNALYKNFNHKIELIDRNPDWLNSIKDYFIGYDTMSMIGSFYYANNILELTGFLYWVLILSTHQIKHWFCKSIYDILVTVCRNYLCWHIQNMSLVTGHFGTIFEDRIHKYSHWFYGRHIANKVFSISISLKQCYDVKMISK